MPPWTNNVACFYCLSTPNPPPLDARSFRCPHCACWNRYDANGEILSDDPAMHDETLNTSSFAKRASPNKLSLPSSYGRGQFCHTCQTNQMLLVNLLSNYLPPPHHPDYAQRLEQLPAYRDSLHIRYPPVCPDCLPAVEDEIEQKNQMARTKALGAWLKQSSKPRLASISPKRPEKLALHLAFWRIRGALWSTTFVGVLVAHATAIQGYHFPHWFANTVPALPILCLLSLFYTAWDPTYYRYKSARVQGRDVRIKGRPHYILLQLLAWLSRFTTSILLFLSRKSSSWDHLHTAAYPSSYRLSTYCSVSLVIELLVFSSSFTVLHLQRPPTIRLVGSSTRSSMRDTPESSTAHSTRASPMPTLPTEPDLLASLSLSSKPHVSSNPMFGHSSLAPPSTASPIKVDDPLDEDAMDWTPTHLSPVKIKKTSDDSEGWVRPQRFFPPERPTGLESLFANTKLDDGDAGSRKPTASGRTGLWKATGYWIATFTVVLVPLGTVAYHRWIKGWIQ